MSFDPWLRTAAFTALAVGLLAVGRPVYGAPEFRAGAATVNITPPLGIEINGGTAPVLATEVHDELHARALVLDDGSIRLAWVTVDNCLMDRGILDAAKTLIFSRAGIPSNAVCISATHTHSAGSVTGVHLSEPDPEYRAWLPGRIADAVRMAANRLAPAEAGWGSGSVPQHVFNRRIRIRSGASYTNLLGRPGDRVKMNWSSPEPSVDGEASGPVDPEVFVLSLRHTDGRPLALLANYSLHYVGGVGPGHLSADYYGVFCDRVARNLKAGDADPPFVALMSNGTSADINNVDFRKERPKQAPYDQIRRVADDVAAEVARVERSLAYQHEVKLGAASIELELVVRRPSPTEVDQARALLHGRTREELHTWPEFYAREQLILADYPETLSLPLQVFRVGDLRIVQWPGKIFAVTGLNLKRRHPEFPLFNISLANGWFGYIPPPEQHALGSYETWRGRTSPLETNAIPRMTGAFEDLLRSLR